MTNKSIRLITCLIFVLIYVIPNGIIFGAFSSIHHHVFAFIVSSSFLLSKLRTRKISASIIILWMLVIGIAIYTGRFSIIDLLSLPVLDVFIQHKEQIKKEVIKSALPYVSLAFTIVYSIIYRKFGIGARSEDLLSLDSGLLVGAIGEVNLTGLSVFLLGVILKKKSKLWGNFTMALGILTVSRNYVLALFVVFIFNLRVVKYVISKLIDKLSYFNLTMFSSGVLFLLGLFFIYLYQTGNILAYSTSEGWQRLLKLNDYSNFYRFLAIYLIVMIMINNPRTLLFGFSNDEFRLYGHSITSALGVDFAGGIGTHNLFFAHIKMYGIAVLLEIIFISKYLKKIVTPNNFGIFIAVFLYSIILGTGLNSYWLFLTIIALIMYE